MKEGWKVGPISDFFEVVTGSTPPKNRPELFGRDFPLVKPPELRNGDVISSKDGLSLAGVHSARMLPKGAVLVSCIGNLGKIGLAATELATNQQINAIVPNEEQAVPRFIFYLTLSPVFQSRLHGLSTGTTVSIVNKRSFSRIEIFLPSIDEQKRIVAILDEAFTGIETAIANAEKNLANVKDISETLLERVISASPTVEETLIDVVDDDCSLSYGIVQPGKQIDDGIPVVRPVDLDQPIISSTGLKRIDPEKAKSYERTRLRGGELLLCVRGTTGTVSQASEALAGGNVTRGIVPIRFADNVIDQNFGYFLLRSAHVQSQIREKTYGAALMQINIRDLRKIRVRVPPIHQQIRMVDKLRQVERDLTQLETNYCGKLSSLAELKRSLLHKAFSGELTAEGVECEVDAATA